MRKEPGRMVGIELTRLDDMTFRLEHWRGITRYHFALFIKRRGRWVKLYENTIAPWENVMPELLRIKAMAPTYRVLEVI